MDQGWQTVEIDGRRFAVQRVARLKFRRAYQQHEPVGMTVEHRRRYRAQRLVDAAEPAARDDDIREAAAFAFDHRIDRLADNFAADIAHRKTA